MWQPDFYHIIHYLSYVYIHLFFSLNYEIHNYYNDTIFLFHHIQYPYYHNPNKSCNFPPMK